MANEATIRVSMTVRKGNLDYQNRPTGFSADVSTAKGPKPGGVTIAVLGTDIDFTGLTSPGLCVIENLDDTNWVEYGIYDPQTLAYYPLGELLPGEIYPLRISRQAFGQYGTTGTGTIDAYANRFRMRANNSPCEVRVEAFER